jgi:hypothetical protein
MTRHLFHVGGLRFANPPYTFPHPASPGLTRGLPMRLRKASRTRLRVKPGDAGLGVVGPSTPPLRA